MLAISERSFSSGTRAGDLSASGCLPPVLAALHSEKKIECNLQNRYVARGVTKCLVNGVTTEVGPSPC